MRATTRPRPTGRLLAAAVVVMMLGAGTGADASSPAASQPSTAGSGTRDPAMAVSYDPPVSPMRVLRRFSAPATPYGPGHRGVDLAAPAGSPVRSAAEGVVSFAGPVAGRGVVVVAHQDGVSTEYEPVTATVHKGQAVVRGQQVGVVAGHHAGCPGDCLHWGAQRDGTYLDPLTLLGPLGVVRLLPWHDHA